MSKLKDLQKEITLLIEKLVEGSANKFENFWDSIAEGFEKFFLH